MAEVTAPLPGRILSIKVKVGDTVKKDQPLFLMEALKMENTIVAVEDGRVEEIHVEDGDDIEAGAAVMELLVGALT